MISVSTVCQQFLESFCDYYVTSAGPDQTEHMCSLIWICIGCKFLKLGFPAAILPLKIQLTFSVELTFNCSFPAPARHQSVMFQISPVPLMSMSTCFPSRHLVQIFTLQSPTIIIQRFIVAPRKILKHHIHPNNIVGYLQCKLLLRSVIIWVALC